MKRAFALSIIILIAFSAFCHAKTIYVQESGTGAGASWADAYGNLQAALDDAVYDDEIWVSAGTYYPDPNGLANPREASFQMINHVGIYGGFPVGGSDFGGRDPNQFETILSGEGDSPSSYDNCFHIFYHPEGTNLDPNAVLDGFTITKGYTYEPGGGMYNYASSPTITYCTFIDNIGEYGGGMYNFNGNPIITNCMFIDNEANRRGGGIYNWGSNLAVTDCAFTGNTAENNGGGIYNLGSNLTLANCTFTGNSTNDDGGGGGMYNAASSLELTNCTFIGNEAEFGRGGGMYDWGSSSSSTVTNCTFSENTARFSGGGMYNGYQSSPTVTNCTFSGNSASDGGGMYNYENSPTVSNCTFSGNSAENEGGGVSNLESNPTFTGCEFTGNTALGGGGICNENSNPTLTDCEFTGNAATYRGGGVYRGNVTVTDCTFTGNLAGGGGGGMDVDISTVANCAFVANSAEYGGGICGSSDITNCTFVGNSAEIAGGGTYGSSNITNCTLVANSADIGGGVYSSGSVFTGNVLVNCIIWGNIAFSNNEVYSSDGKYTSRALISFCNIKGSGGSGAVWDESLGFDEGGNIDVDPMFIDADGADNITGTEDDDLHLLPYSPCVNTGSNDAASLPTTDFEGDSRIIHDIVDMGVDESVDQMFFLHVTSQPSARACTVTFDPTEYAYLPGTEVTITVDGEGGYIFDHFSGDLADDNNQVTITMDSHKYVTAHFAIDSDIIYVDKSATGFNNGTSWENALNEFYEALITAGEPNEIWVAAGIYKPGYDYGLAMGERGKHFRMLNNVEMYGGFPAGGSDFAGRDYDLYRTILSGDLLGNDDPTIPYDDPTIPDEQIFGDPTLADNCCHVFCPPDGYALDPNAVLDGFTITAGNASLDQHHSIGGGMLNYGNSSPTVSNCKFSRNSSRNSGSGMFNSYSDMIITNCIFNYNYKSGMYNGSSNLTVIDCTFANNSHTGMYNYSGNMAVINCAFVNNSSDGMINYSSNATVADCVFTNNLGSGIKNYSSNPLVINNIFVNNYSSGIYNSQSSPTVSHCILTGNSASEGGGMYSRDNSNPTVTNSIFWNNSATLDGNEIAAAETSTINISYCDVQDGLDGVYDDLDGNTINWGPGNIDTDPLFVYDGYWDPNDTPGDASDDFWVDGDYHLKSEGWRWDNDANDWTWDRGVTSPCIDAGNPGASLGDEPMTLDVDPTNEFGENLRINMGVYGGTAEASMPPYGAALLADMTNNGIVDADDLSVMVGDWLNADSEQPGDLDRDGVITFTDFVLLAYDWFETTRWYR